MADLAGSRPAGGVRPSPRTLTVIAVLLTFASGASDVASFTRLGNVFTSVMTGNMVMFGLSLAQGSVSLAAHTVVAFCGYVAGVATGTRIAWRHAEHRRTPGPGRRTATDDSQPSEDEWPPHITLTLLTEMTLFIGVVIGWLVTGTHPAGAAQLIILVLAACAMGVQSAAVSQMGLGNVSTTYLTGTLTGLVAAIARPDGTRAGRRRSAVLLGLLSGAALAGLFVAYAAAVTPFLPLLAIAAAAALESGRFQPPDRAATADKARVTGATLADGTANAATRTRDFTLTQAAVWTQAARKTQSALKTRGGALTQAVRKRGR